MRTVDETVVRAPVDRCFRAGAEVERWPELLSHYRWVRFHRRDRFGTGRVEMAAVRRFGRFAYPVWWVSEMRVDEQRPAVSYRHVEGVTTGMDVEWSFEDLGDGRTRVRIVHEWGDGPRWPIPAAARRTIAEQVIGPVFIHRVASRTLQGIQRYLESYTDQRESR